MTVDPRLVTIVPHETHRVVANWLDVVELEVPAFDEHDWAVVPLAAGAGAVASEKLVRVNASMAVRPIDFHYSGATRRAKLEGLECSIVHDGLPSQRPDAVAVRCRTDTVA